MAMTSTRMPSLLSQLPPTIASHSSLVRFGPVGAAVKLGAATGEAERTGWDGTRKSSADGCTSWSSGSGSTGDVVGSIAGGTGSSRGSTSGAGTGTGTT